MVKTNSNPTTRRRPKCGESITARVPSTVFNEIQRISVIEDRPLSSVARQLIVAGLAHRAGQPKAQ